MNKEFKKFISKNETRYVLETATAGATSSAVVASNPSSIGELRRRLQELKAKIDVPVKKPRNPVGMGSTQGRGTQRHQTTQRKQSRDEKKMHEESTPLIDRQDYMQKRQVLQKMLMDPENAKNKFLINKIRIRRAELEKQARAKGFALGETDQDHEISMASSELTSIAKDATNLLNIVKQRSEEEGLEAWQQSKITKAADFMNSVLQSISGDEEQGVAEGFPHDVDHMPGPTKKHSSTNCTSCHGRKSMYKLGGKLFADNKQGATKVKCPTCKGTGDKQDMAEGDFGRDEFKRQELDYELRNEPPNNIQIAINGKKWKVFAGRGKPGSSEEYSNFRKMKDWAERKSAATGKKWEVYLTAAPPTNESNMSEGFDSPEQEAAIRNRLEQVQEYDPDNSYKIVADEFDMTEEELRAALHQSFSMREGLRDPKDNPCWKGYKPVGTKKKGGRTVPNCVPTNEDAYINKLMAALESKK